MSDGDIIVSAKDLTRPVTGNPGRRLVLMGNAAGGSIAQGSYGSVESPEELEPAIGNGLLTEYGGQVLRTLGNHVFYPLQGSGASISAVTQSGSGPLIALAGTPSRALNIKVKVTSGAVLSSGSVKVKIALDGITYGPEITLSAPSAAELVGTVDLTGVTLSSLNTLTFTCVTEDANPVTFAMASYASIAALITALNGGIVADSSNAVVQTTLRAGKYLVVKSGTTGSTSTIDSDNGGGDGTGMAALGLAAQSDVGTDSEYLIPGTDITITFPAGTYVTDEIYSATTTPDVVSLATYTAAIENFPRDEVEFSAFAIIHDFVDEFDAKTYIDSITASVKAYQTSEPRRYVGVYFGMCLGNNGSASAIKANDDAVRAMFAGTTSKEIWWAHGDCYMAGFRCLGSFRVSALAKLLLRAVALDESQSVGQRDVGQDDVISMTGPDGVRARDENTALTKMGDRWSVLKAEKGVCFVSTGRTAALPGTEPGFNELAYIRPFMHAMQITHDVLHSKLEQTFDALKNGTMRPEDREGDVNAAVNTQLDIEINVARGARTDGRPRASSSTFALDPTINIVEQKKYVGTLTHQPLGIVHSGEVTALLVGTVEAEV